MPNTAPDSNIQKNQKEVKKSSSSIEFKSPVFKFLVLLVVGVGLLAAYVLSHPSASSVPQLSNLYLNSPSKKLVKGKTYSIAVWVDTKGQPVNAVQADLIYPSSKLSVVGVDSSKSALTISAQSQISNGLVKIARGNISSITGKQLVAVVKVKALTNSGKATISFASSSAVARATDNKNILTGTTGVNFMLSLMHNNFLPSNLLNFARKG
jgi:hypothetical protein